MESTCDEFCFEDSRKKTGAAQDVDDEREARKKTGSAQKVFEGGEASQKKGLCPESRWVRHFVRDNAMEKLEGKLAMKIFVFVAGCC